MQHVEVEATGPLRQGTGPPQSGAGVGVVLLMVLWFLVLWFYGFMVLWFYGCVVLWFQGFMVLWFYAFMVLWFCSFMFLWFYEFVVLWLLGFESLPISISCFQEIIDPISKIFKILVNGSPGFFGARLSKLAKHAFPKC